MVKISLKRKVTYRRFCYPIGPVPAIILEGKFMAAMGWKTGTYFMVDYCQPGKIVITKLGNELQSLLPEKA